MIEHSVTSLLDELLPETQMLLKCASLLKGEFSLSELFAFRDLVMRDQCVDEASFTDLRSKFQCPGTAYKILQENSILEDIVIEDTEDGDFAEADRCRFTHSLMRKVAYESLTSSQQILLQSVYLDLLEARPEKPSLMFLAAVAENGNVYGKAARYYMEAASGQSRAFANKSAQVSIYKARENLQKELFFPLVGFFFFFFSSSPFP